MFRKESDFDAFGYVMVERTCGNPFVSRRIAFVITLAGGTAGELDGSRSMLL